MTKKLHADTYCCCYWVNSSICKREDILEWELHKNMNLIKMILIHIKKMRKDKFSKYKIKMKPKRQALILCNWYTSVLVGNSYAGPRPRSMDSWDINIVLFSTFSCDSISRLRLPPARQSPPQSAATVSSASQPPPPPPPLCFWAFFIRRTTWVVQSQQEMAEKGGKGFSLPKGSLKGKDDNSSKSKKGRKVQIDFEDSLEPISPKTNGKVNTPVSRGDSGKGGKGDKAASGGKNSVTKAPSLEFKIEEELPKNTKCLMDCEAAEILQGIQDRMVVLSADPAIKIPISFDRSLTYAKRDGLFSNSQAVRKILEPLKKYGVSDGEICMIANLKVESDDEVFALVPSLKDKSGKMREPLKSVLNELAKLQSSA